MLAILVGRDFPAQFHRQQECDKRPCGVCLRQIVAEISSKFRRASPCSLESNPWPKDTHAHRGRKSQQSATSTKLTPSFSEAGQAGAPRIDPPSPLADDNIDNSRSRRSSKHVFHCRFQVYSRGADDKRQARAVNRREQGMRCVGAYPTLQGVKLHLCILSAHCCTTLVQPYDTRSAFQ